MPKVEAYIAIQRFEIVCISEKCLDFSTIYDDNNLEIAVYNLIQFDHPSNKKRGGGWIYQKSSLLLRVLSTHYLQECINFKFKIGAKLYNLISLYRSASQS